MGRSVICMYVCMRYPREQRGHGGAFACGVVVSR